MAQGTAKEHLDWCVGRAMEYANQGDMTNAWASFVSDVGKHPGTEHIGRHELTGMMMLFQVQRGSGVREFQYFITGWNV